MTETPARSAISLRRIIRAGALKNREPLMGVELRSLLTDVQSHKGVPRQCSFRRKVSQKELPARCIKRAVRRLRRTRSWSPARISLIRYPSALKIVAGLGVMTLISIVASSGKIKALLERVCGQIGVSASTSAVGKITAPPAARE